MAIYIYSLSLFLSMTSVKDPLIDNKHFYNFESNFLHYFGWVSKIMVVLFIFGFFQQKPILFINFSFLVKIGLAFFLIYRFNSYRKYKITFTDLDRKVCYSAGIYILFISFADLINSYILDIKEIIDPYTEKFFLWVKRDIINT